MTADDNLGFAPDDDQPIAYMQRTRDYYLTLGYGNPYRWAHYDHVPFQPLAKPLTQSRVALVTTAAPYQADKGDQGPGAAYNASAKFYAAYSGRSDEDHDVRISHIAYDRTHTTAEDPNSWFPLPLLRQFAAEGRIGALAPRFHGAPTNRSQKTTIETDAPEILERCRADGVDAVVLVPNCPVCHQTVSLVARHLEANGIATVVMGCAKDIVEFVGVPRFLFSDFPLGNSAGRPKNPVSQRQTLALALDLLEAAPGARTTMQSPQRWSASADWKRDFMNPARIPAEEIARQRAENDRQKAIAKTIRSDGRAAGC
ncbi:glycine/sarcosine/betaine reductase selenoprotein B family protein [Phreatobacter stygius]|uniref:Glycine reductase n=1 Tax=Phreatobacter stygius TaxID=1940610 RepID=A0A4D7AZR3_9HYPH|nr:glycine/sarcosine/betaine reductase selenoprotein B family protein [Phreatobacter stygius]QCI65851.1 glycine reductase [Phreatobacter stygius]